MFCKKQAYVSGNVLVNGTYQKNVKTKQLHLSKPLYVRSSDYMPMTVSLEYIGDTDFAALNWKTGFGKNWKLNLQQYFIWQNSQYEYYDAKGLKHVFALAENSTTEYYDTSGTGLTATVVTTPGTPSNPMGTMTVTMKDLSNNVYTFKQRTDNPTRLHLTRVQDAYGHYLNIWYSENYPYGFGDGKGVEDTLTMDFSILRFTQLQQNSAQASAPAQDRKKITFAYTDSGDSTVGNQLTTLKGATSATDTFTYGSDFKLSSAKSSHGTNVIFETNKVTEKAVKSSNESVTQVYEIAGSAPIFTVTDRKGEVTKYRYAATGANEGEFLAAYEDTNKNEQKYATFSDEALLVGQESGGFRIQSIAENGQCQMARFEANGSVSANGATTGELEFAVAENSEYYFYCDSVFDLIGGVNRTNAFGAVLKLTCLDANGEALSATDEDFIKIPFPENDYLMKKGTEDLFHRTYANSFHTPHNCAKVKIQVVLMTDYSKLTLTAAAVSTPHPKAQWCLVSSGFKLNYQPPTVFFPRKTTIKYVTSAGQQSEDVFLTDEDWMQNLKSAAFQLENVGWAFVANGGKKRIVNPGILQILASDGNFYEFNGNASTVNFRTQLQEMRVEEIDDSGVATLSAKEMYLHFIFNKENGVHLTQNTHLVKETYRQTETDQTATFVHGEEENHVYIDCDVHMNVVKEYKEDGTSVTNTYDADGRLTKTVQSAQNLPDMVHETEYSAETYYAIAVEKNRVGGNIYSQKNTYYTQSGVLYRTLFPEVEPSHEPLTYSYRNKTNKIGGVWKNVDGELISESASFSGDFCTQISGSNWAQTFNKDNYGNLQRSRLNATGGSERITVIEGNTVLNNGADTVDSYEQSHYRQGALGDTFTYYYDKHGRMVRLSVHNQLTDESDYLIFIYSTLAANRLATVTNYDLTAPKEAKLRKVIDKFVNKVYTYEYDEAGNVIGSSTYNLLNDTYDWQSPVVVSSVGQKGETQVSDYKVSAFNSRLKQTVKQNNNGQVEKITHQVVSSTLSPTVETQALYDAHLRPTGFTRSLKNHYGDTVAALASNNFTYYACGSETTPYVQSETVALGSFNQTNNYTYDAKGNISACNQTAYVYDGFGRLIAEQKSGNSVNVTYDADSNVLTKTGYPNGFTYGNFNRLTSYNGTSITYDVAGNPLSWVGKNNTLITDITYSRRNLPSGATVGSAAVAFTYDGLGNRIGKTVGSTAYTYYYNGNRLAAWQKGSETYYCLYDNTGICGFYRNGQLYLFAKNMLGDVIALYYVGSSTATVMAKYEYDAWGVCTVKNPDGTVNTSADFIGNINPFRYRGYYYDTELDLYWLKTRHYDPKVGRFLTADSIQYYDSSVIGGTNLYAYCLNNPINLIDPTGCFWDYVLDAVFIAWSITDLINGGYKDWKNWAALGIDVVFAVLPFVPSGAGQVIKVGNKIDNAVDVAKAINKVDNIQDATKITMIGRSMDRVTDTANLLGKTDNLYDAWKGYDKAATGAKRVLHNGISVSHDACWMFGKLRSGYTVIDIGVTTAHRGVGLWYGAERFVVGLWKTRNFWKIPVNFYL